MQSPPPAVFHDKYERTQQGNLLNIPAKPFWVEFKCHKIFTITERNNGHGHKQFFARKIVQKSSVIQQTNQKLNNAVRCQDILLNTVQNIQLCKDV